MATQRIFSECFLTLSATTTTQTTGVAGWFPTGATTVGYATDVTVNFKGDTMEITNAQTAGNAKDFLPGLTEWDMDISSMWVRGTLAGTGGTYITADDLVLNMINSNPMVILNFTSTITGDYSYKGTAIITSGSLSTKIGDKTTAKFAFKGCGAIVPAKI